METADKVREVGMKPLSALTKICQEYSQSTLLAGKLEKFHNITDKAIENKLKSKQLGKQEQDSNVAMFPDGTLENLTNIIKEQRGEQTEEEILK